MGAPGNGLSNATHIWSHRLVAGESSVEITKPPITPNTMKIDMWVPLGMDILTALRFGRSDAQILISVAVYASFMRD